MSVVEPGSLASESPDSSIPISMVSHWLFCNRRAWLESVGEHVDSYQMEVGADDHRRADDASASTTETKRAVNVHHSELGVHGRVDVIESAADGSLTIVEYKATPVRRSPEVTRPMRIQLALQSICLTAAGETVTGHAVHFTSHRRRVPVALDEQDFSLAREALEETRLTLSAPVAPPPLVDDARCFRCSHASVCLPDERRAEPPDRRIGVADPLGQVVHVASYGARVHLKEGRLRAERRGETLAEVPIELVHALVIHGNADASSGLIRELLWRGKQIVWASGRGKVVGWAQPGRLPNSQVRNRQHLDSHRGRLDLARGFVTAKIANQATLLRRNGDAVSAVQALRASQSTAEEAHSLEALLGVEGAAARTYFGAFLTMLNERSREFLEPLFPGRVGRGATDPLNVVLNFAYGMLRGEVIRAIVACGLDPYAGYLHSSGRGKPALALDLMEEFRAPIADSVAISSFNNGELGRKSFMTAFADHRLTDRGRKQLITAFERRVQTVFTHPLFEYRVSWRRAMEVQARLILGVLDGTQSTYAGIRIR